MSKRKFDDGFDQGSRKSFKITENIKKHSLDSDEEDDNYDAEDIMHEDDIEGEEDGVANDDGEVRITAFNMREELEEGHFDGQGHFIWNNEKEVKDNWLDNIDWQRIKPGNNSAKADGEIKGLGDDSDSDEEAVKFDELSAYKKLIQYLQPKETITKALRRLGGTSEKLSSIERLRRKKAGILNVNQQVTELTALADSILTELGNMDIYQENFENITEKIIKLEKKDNPRGGEEAELDMYADDFDDKEKEKLHLPGTSSGVEDDTTANKEVQWEYKLLADSSDILGPFSTQEMLDKVVESVFKSGAWARTVGNDKFYSTNRIDFELYLS